MASRQHNDDSTQPESHTNYRYLNMPQMKVQMQRLHVKAKVSEQ